MIDKFSTVYAGHVDLGDMGQQATPANERRYSNDHLASVFAKTEAIARCMDEHGYQTLWLAEHHFQHEGYECLPNILMVGVHLAHLTTRLRTGCGFKSLETTYPGLEHVHLSNSMGTPQNVMLEQLAWLGKEVMPSFVAR